jgi:hypothetical protein
MFIEHGRDSKYGISRDDLMRITQINVEIACFAVRAEIHNPVISFDRISDYLNWGTIILFGYERFHVLIPFFGAFGHGAYGVFATPRATAMALIQRSDLIILTDPVMGRQAFYPINTKIKEYWGEMRDWVRRNRVSIFSTVILGIPHEVFARNYNSETSTEPRQAGPKVSVQSDVQAYFKNESLRDIVSACQLTGAQ